MSTERNRCDVYGEAGYGADCYGIGTVQPLEARNPLAHVGGPQSNESQDTVWHPQDRWPRAYDGKRQDGPNGTGAHDPNADGGLATNPNGLQNFQIYLLRWVWRYTTWIAEQRGLYAGVDHIRAFVSDLDCVEFPIYSAEDRVMVIPKVLFACPLSQAFEYFAQSIVCHWENNRQRPDADWLMHVFYETPVLVRVANHAWQKCRFTTYEDDAPLDSPDAVWMEDGYEWALGEAWRRALEPIKKTQGYVHRGTSPGRLIAHRVVQASTYQLGRQGLFDARGSHQRSVG